MVTGQIKQRGRGRACRVRPLHRLGNPLHGLRHGLAVESHGMGQHHGVDFGMGQVEAAAQGMAQLVVQGHAHVAKHHAAQPGAIERVPPGLQHSFGSGTSQIGRAHV